MAQPSLPLLVEPAELESRSGAPNLLPVDLNRAEVYAQSHLPGAVRVDYADINATRAPAMGLLPSMEHLGEIMSNIGLTPQAHVVAYDAEGGSRAARFLWTLEAIGHRNYSLLNGGLIAWQHERKPLSDRPLIPKPSSYRAVLHDEVIADKAWILKHLGNPGVVLLDARTSGEFDGSIVRAARGGHIPGAVNYDYVNAIDTAHQLRLRPLPELREGLIRLGATPEKEIIAYCQTHHRSAHTWFVLKLLGYPKLRGYPGSWSEWGNSPDTPIE